MTLFGATRARHETELSIEERLGLLGRRSCSHVADDTKRPRSMGTRRFTEGSLGFERIIHPLAGLPNTQLASLSVQFPERVYVFQAHCSTCDWQHFAD